MANIQAKFISLKTNKFLQFIVYSNLWISLGAALLCWQVFYLNKLEINLNYIFFVFFSTLVSYNIQRLFRLETIAVFNKNAWIVNHHKTAFVFSLIGLIGAAITLFQFISYDTLFWLIPSGIISLFYSLKSLRDIPYLKIFLISISWGIICGIIPIILQQEYTTNQILLNSLIIVCYITAITIPFDIRDLGLDEDTKRTIPQILGVKKSKLSSLIILGISILLFSLLFSQLQLLIYVFSSIISGGLIYYSNKSKPDIYYSFFIDGHIILQFLLLFFLS